MKRFSIAAALLLTYLATVQSALAQPAYLRSDIGRPFDLVTNEAVMNRVFGQGNWDDLRYETVDVAVLFSGATEFIFMEGGDDNANRMEHFIRMNFGRMQTWVNNGGRLFINAAPNVGDGMPYGFGVRLLYSGSPGEGCRNGTAVDPSHPIFIGPFTPVGTEYSAAFFCHAVVRSPDLVPLIVNANGFTALGAMQFGDGLALFGSMSPSVFHSPQPAADNLRANIIAYAAAGVLFEPISRESLANARPEESNAGQ